MKKTLSPPTNPKTAPKYYIESYGCQMNEYDAGIASNFLEQSGLELCNSPDKAKVILLNTCAIRENAHEKIYARLESLAHLKQSASKPIIGILGCMAQILGDDLFANGLPVDFVLGPDNYRNLKDIVQDFIQNEKQSYYSLTQLSRTESYEDVYAKRMLNDVSAFVTIMRGCDNFCSFCVVPYTRGRERSLSMDSIIQEIEYLIDHHSIKEVILLGQNVNSYHYNQKFTFTNLIEEILKKTSIERIRFTSPHPKDFPTELLDLMQGEERFCSQIHLPLQSGSNSVLERMKRDYTAKIYLDLVDKMHAKLSHRLGLSTDIIVGFCDETERDFEETLAIVKEVPFDMAFMFKYSERKYTSASKYLEDSVPEEVKKERLTRLIQVQRTLSAERNKSFIGKKYDVLVESHSKKSKQELMGRTESGKTVVFSLDDSPIKQDIHLSDYLGSFKKVRIIASTSATLKAIAV